MNNVPQPIKDKAFSLGIKPGAEVTSAAFPDYPSFIVPPTDRWEVWGDGVLTGDMPERGSSYLKYGGKWATVITPAPSEAEGLKEGDAAILKDGVQVVLEMLAWPNHQDVRKRAHEWVVKAEDSLSSPRL